MRYPRLLVYESDGRLAVLLENSSTTAPFLKKTRTPDEPAAPPVQGPHNWSLRQPRRLDACLRLLQGGAPCILVVRIASKLPADATAEARDTEQRRRERALHLLDRAAWLRPETVIVAVSDVADDALSSLAWELGAAHVLCPPQPVALLPEIVAHLMQPREVAT
jgi:hypothetical protein